jgi:SAM-dependent methyltransferase
VGRPALARETGCQVTVLDLTATYCRAGEQLTVQAGLADRVRFQQCDALEMPFADGGFDVVWTQHSTMNIPDKPRLYAQVRRVLRAGGRLAFQEVTSDSGAPLLLPTMWAHTEAMSFLVAPEALRALLAGAGFRELAWHDLTADASAWLARRQQAQPPGGCAGEPPGVAAAPGRGYPYDAA